MARTFIEGEDDLVQLLRIARRKVFFKKYSIVSRSSDHLTVGFLADHASGGIVSRERDLFFEAHDHISVEKLISFFFFSQDGDLSYDACHYLVQCLPKEYLFQDADQPSLKFKHLMNSLELISRKILALEQKYAKDVYLSCSIMLFTQSKDIEDFFRTRAAEI